MFRRKIKKLKYKIVEYSGIKINFARSTARTLHITIKSDGEVYYVVPYGTSENDILKFLEKKKDWLINNIKKFEEKNGSTEKNFDDLKFSYRDKRILKEKIKFYIEKYERLMNIKVNRISLQKMKTRWGSCSYMKKNIRFNLMLLNKSDDFIEYVVVHEMCHFFVHDHSSRFKALETKYLPNWRVIKKEGKSF